LNNNNNKLANNNKDDMKNKFINNKNSIAKNNIQDVPQRKYFKSITKIRLSKIFNTSFPIYEDQNFFKSKYVKYATARTFFVKRIFQLSIF
jgi:hypothetical protein